ncbi:MAG: sodium/solute symporter [Pseudomonadota bacterium]
MQEFGPSFGTLNWAIIAAYLLGNLYLGWRMSRRISSAEDYNFGDRSTPWWAIGISVMATYVSALSFLGGPAWAYGDGMAALAIHINYPLVIFVVIVFFLPFFFNSGLSSIYEYLERRFGPASRTVMSLLFMMSQSITTASILTATAIVITFVTGIEPRTAIIAMSIIVVLYTLMGGMNAVIWTDVLQGVILFIGAGIVLYFLLVDVAPMSNALGFLAENDKLNPLDTSLDLTIAPTVWSGVLAMTLFHITVYGGNQMMVQRAMAAKNIGDAKKSYLMMGYGAFVIYFLFFFIGALLFVHFEGKPFDQTNEIILTFANSLAIPGLMGILVAAVLSASMSSLSSAFNSLSTVSVVDFYKPFAKRDASERHYLNAARVFTLVWAVIVIPMAFAFIESGGSILETLSKVGSYLVGAKLAMFGLGFFSKHTNEKGLLIGVVAGFVSLAVVTGFAGFEGLYPNLAWPWYVVLGGGVNIAVSWIASVLIGGFQSEWHEHSVPGQKAKFATSGAPQSDNGWYVVPGLAEAPVWGLLIAFAAIILFLAWFGSLV